MNTTSAGLLMCRKNKGNLEFFLIHPGGPFYAKKNDGVWSIPKGLVESGEELLPAGQREFLEETGLTAVPPFYTLGAITLKTGKTIYAWAFLGEWNEEMGIVSNKFDLEWPPKSSRMIQVPEADLGAWMNLDEAKLKINKSQIPFLERASAIFSER